MSTALLPLSGPIDYPESDGEPMADNTKQFRWIVVLFTNLANLFTEVLDVFVGGNLIWYPAEGQPETKAAPDVFVVFGRPKGDRSSYKQWEEGNVPMTVVFEVLSPTNTVGEMADKFAFYEDCGVEEYYLYDPDSNTLRIYMRRGEVLARVRQVRDFVSPRLGIRFDLSGREMVVRLPDGQPFLTFEQLQTARKQAEQQLQQEQQQRLLAQQRADQAEQGRQQAEQRAARLAELSRKALRRQATAEELAELERLAEQPEQGG
jgi:Uma2 family endonuclease